MRFFSLGILVACLQKLILNPRNWSKIDAQTSVYSWKIIWHLSIFVCHLDLNTVSFEIYIYDMIPLKLIEFSELCLPWCANVPNNAISKTSFTVRQGLWWISTWPSEMPKMLYGLVCLLIARPLWHMYHFILVWPIGLCQIHLEYKVCCLWVYLS